MQERLEFDAVVVGAGPAGSVTARTIAGDGKRVALLEEHPQVGRPVHCSGFVSPRILRLPHFPSEVVLNEVVGAVVYGPGKASLALGGDRTYGLVLDRCALDQRLAARAQQSGAELLLQHRFLDATPTAGRMAVRCRTPAGEVQLRGHLVARADGAQGVVARRSRDPGEIIWCLGAEAMLPSHPRDWVRVYVGHAEAPGWFAWTIPVGDGRVRIGVGSLFHPRRAASPRALLRRLLEGRRDHFAGCRLLQLSGGFIPLYSPLPTVGPGMVRVGDAARQVKPTTGGGIYMSMLAGELAGQAMNEALRQGDTSAASLRRYEARWQGGIGEELQRGQDLRAIFTRLSDRQLRLLLWLFSRPGLQGIISRYGDIDYQSP
ncbi:MAG: NAD(P)/FAD-dependent oxidoreductase, partial [Chloroflexi bacterium]|nr:NAD(P)/FAD-dependent oxidoreductase [Chloroflexota bacterium]